MEEGILMATLSSTFRAHTPITQAELTFQRRSSAAQRPRRWWRLLLAWPYRLLVVVAIISSIALISAEITALLIGYDFAWLPSSAQNIAGIFLFFIPLVTLIPITLLLHFKAQLRTLTFASNAISREKRGGTWDLLLLTPVDARQIVRGKWWATLRHVWGDYALLALLRAGSLVWMVMEANRIHLSGYPDPQFEIELRHFDPSLLHIMLGMAAIVGFTMLNAVYTSALGTLGSVFARGGGTSLTLAIVVRVVTLIGTALLLGGIAHLVLLRLLSSFGSDDYYFSWPGHLYRILAHAAITLSENGVLVSGALMSYSPPTVMSYDQPSASFYTTYTNGIIAGGLVALLVYVLFAWFALLLAQWVVRRQGALRPTRLEQYSRRQKKKNDVLLLPE